MDAPSSLHFHGPFTFVDHGRGIARCQFAQSAGVHLWVLTDGNSRYIHYIGQTPKFLNRHEDHLFCILGFGYGLFRDDAVAASNPDWLFPGKWRLWRTNPGDDPLTFTVSKWKELQHKIVPYVESIEVFFAPTPGLSNYERCHVEGCIAAKLRNKNAVDARFYPTDCHTGASEALGITIPVTSDQPIMGLDPFFRIMSGLMP